MKKECTLRSNYRVITHYNTHYQDLMEQKMEKEENKEIYKKRANNEKTIRIPNTLNWTNTWPPKTRNEAKQN